jgi:hypothetical protein
MKITFFNAPKPKRFNYQPVFYNEAKERRMERERKIREEMGLPPMEGDENRSSEDRIRGKFTSSLGGKNIEFARGTKKVSNIRILVIAFILFMLIYLIYGSGIDRFLSFFKF